MATIKNAFPDQVRVGTPSGRYPFVIGPCWLWTGKTDKGGYGVCAAGPVHRFSLFLATGYYGDSSCHKCDVRICCNPEHLFWGTDEDNTIDLLKWALVVPVTSARDYDRLFSLAQLHKRHIAKMTANYRPGIVYAVQQVTRGLDFPGIDRAVMTKLAQKFLKKRRDDATLIRQLIDVPVVPLRDGQRYGPFPKIGRPARPRRIMDQLREDAARSIGLDPTLLS